MTLQVFSAFPPTKSTSGSLFEVSIVFLDAHSNLIEIFFGFNSDNSSTFSLTSHVSLYARYSRVTMCTIVWPRGTLGFSLHLEESC
jgi:hypothetical protein